MASLVINEILNGWVVQAVVASRYLAKLYRIHKDPRQADLALKAGNPAEQRVERLNLQHRVRVAQDAFLEAHPEEVAAEEAAWKALVEAHSGHCAYHAMIEFAGGPEAALQGPRSRAHKALECSIRGYRAAFPDSMMREGLLAVVHQVSETCAEAMVKDLRPEERALATPEEYRKDIYEMVEGAMLRALEQSNLL